MTEQEQQRLISGLIKQRESWQPARQRAHKKPVAKRMSQRDRDYGMLSQPLTGRMDGVGEVLKTNPSQRGTTRPLKFLRTVFFLKIKQTGKQ